MRFDFLRDLKDTPHRFASGQRAFSRRARTARSEGEARLWRAQTRALEQVEAWLSGAPNKLGPLTAVAERLVDRRLTSLTALPIAGYEDMNAKEASRAIRDLGAGASGSRRRMLLVVERYEASHKKRKTVLKAIEDELRRLDRPEPEPPAVDAQPEPPGAVTAPA